MQFGFERQLYSTVEDSGGVDVCVDVLQGNVTQQIIINIQTFTQCKYHTAGKLVLNNPTTI